MANPWFLKGHTACAGCGCVIAIDEMLKALGPDVVVVNATGCMEIVSSVYPTPNWKVPYVHSLFENVPAVASGISRAFKTLGKKGVVLGFSGDGGAYDIGFGALSGAMERNEDMLFVIYDNEAYMNTGVQRSGATPFHAATTTSPQEVSGKREWKKDISFIAAAHGVPYVATASIAFPVDFKNKLAKAKAKKGFRLVTVYANCPIGWRHDSALTIEIAKKAVESGMWQLFEIEDGIFKRTYKPKQLVPVESYLSPQGRFKHLTPEMVKLIQEHINKTAADLDRLEGSSVDFRYLE